MSAETTVVVVDDHEVLRTGLKYVLEPHNIRIVGDTDNPLRLDTLCKVVKFSLDVVGRRCRRTVIHVEAERTRH